MTARTMVACLAAAAVFAQPKSHEVTVAGDKQWVDTGIDLQAGDKLRIEASGTLQYAGAKPAGPEGVPRGWRDLLRILPFNDAGRGALIGRIGSSDAARPFLIGPRRESTVPVAGRLFLGINQGANERAEGSFTVKIERTPAAAAPGPVLPVAKLTQELLDRIPRRVIDADGNLGDRVNFVIVGSEEKVRGALEAAGWVKVDRSTQDAVIRSVLASVSKQAYVTLPMSELRLFDRPQDYGWAQADPLMVVAARHHFRIWKAPFTLAGQTVWAGAGTHDIGFDRDQRNNKITHKIDPEVDKERDYIGRSLELTGQVALRDYLTPADPVREAKTAHGASFFSDGRTLIIYLKPDTLNASAAFADLFCSVLPHTGEWGACSQYVETAGRADLALEPVPTKYRVLIVPGFFSSCVADTPAFLEGQEHLRDKYGLSVELLGVPNDSSEDNARRIAHHLRERMREDARKFIVIGYSKGTPDLQVTLAKEPGAADAVAGFVSVAGASGGSPIADVLPSQLDRWIRDYRFGKCEGDASAGFKSVRQDVRRAFLASFPNPVVPTYSLAATSDKTNTSKALLQTWQLLSAFDKALDGQLTRQDALIPGAKYLGTARADHFAVALPFDKSPEATIRSGMDKTRYPRAALLEALVRFVIQDLEGAK